VCNPEMMDCDYEFVSLHEFVGNIGNIFRSQRNRTERRAQSTAFPTHFISNSRKNSILHKLIKSRGSHNDTNFSSND
jgi:hypothetical protein